MGVSRFLAEGGGVAKAFSLGVTGAEAEVTIPLGRFLSTVGEFAGGEDVLTSPSHCGTAFRWIESCLFASVAGALWVVWYSVECEGDGGTTNPFARFGIGGGRGRGTRGRGACICMLLSDVPLPLLLRFPCERCFFTCDGVRVTLETNVCERWICAPPESATACPAEDGGGKWFSCSVEGPRPSLETIRPKRPFGFSFGTGVCERGGDGGGPSAKKSMSSRVLAEVAIGAGALGVIGTFSPRSSSPSITSSSSRDSRLRARPFWGRFRLGVPRLVSTIRLDCLRSSEDTGVALVTEILRFRPEPLELEPPAPNKTPEKLLFRLRERVGVGGTGSGISSRSRMKDLGSDLELAADRRVGLGGLLPSAADGGFAPARRTFCLLYTCGTEGKNAHGG